MTPLDLIFWALAAAISAVIVGMAVAIVLAAINGMRNAR